MNYNNLPAYLLCVLSAAWFALMAYQLRKSRVLWCIGGAILGLCIAAICLGVADAITLPYTPSQFHKLEWDGIAVAVLAIGITGAIIAVANRARLSSPRPNP